MKKVYKFIKPNKEYNSTYTYSVDKNYPLRVYLTDTKTGKVTEHFHKVINCLKEV